jgi:two-component system, chemotaxis family, sensor kinase CheA
VGKEHSVDKELIDSFVIETRDYLDEIEPTLLEFASGSISEDMETINSIFRAFHSVKGSAGFLGFKTFESVTHRAENILDKVRIGKAKLTSQIVDVLCETIDMFRNMLETVEHTGLDTGFEEEAQEVKDLLDGLLRHEESEVDDKPEEDNPRVINQKSVVEINLIPPPEQRVEITPEMAKLFLSEVEELLESLEHALLCLNGEEQMDGDPIAEAFRSIHSFKGNCGIMGLVDLQNLSHFMESILDLVKNKVMELTEDMTESLLKLTDVLRKTVLGLEEQPDGNIAGLAVYLELLTSYMPEKISKKVSEVKQIKARENLAAFEQKSSAAAKASGAKNITRQDIRVDLSKVDSLLDLIGELVIAEAMVTRNPLVSNIDDPVYERSKHQLRRITTDLQDIAMSIRMVPLAPTFRKMIRLVHDVSSKAGKQIDLKIVGEETEIDKTVIEKISDPLVHIVRNACDHGIESPDERKAAGKPPHGQVIIEGRHEDGEVWILVKDDGKGLHRDVIAKKAVEKNIISAEEVAQLTDSKVFNLIFEPGFSTAAKVTDISGRGVGMDVVRKNIERLNGKVDIQSVPGEGSVFILRIPLTLAIIDGMLVRVGNHVYTLPLLSIQESFRPNKQMITCTPDGGELVKLRNEMLPVLRLAKIFNQTGEFTELIAGTLVVVEDDDNRIALFVDELMGQQQTVIKGLSSYLGNARGTSGCTILGDGTISLIVDVGSLVKMYQANGVLV